VRKTAAVCVAKLYDIDPPLVQEQGFIDALTDLLSDANPMVVANAVAALSEIHEYSKSMSGRRGENPPRILTSPTLPTAGSVFELNPNTVSKLLTALNECTEWGQVFILDSLALYEPPDDRDRQSMCERVTPRLQHVNAAVVLSAVKVGVGGITGLETICSLSYPFQVLMKNIDRLQDNDLKTSFYKKLAPPLVTLLSSEPEVQYVALRNINLIVQKRPNILANEAKVGSFGLLGLTAVEPKVQQGDEAACHPARPPVAPLRCAL
jgi:AP-1 complex subunit beta-1